MHAILRYIRSAIVIAATLTELLSLSLKDFDRLKKSIPLKLLKKEESLLPTSLDVKLLDLKHMRFLGAGAFGEVSLVQSQVNKETFALKKMGKMVISKRKLQAQVIREKKLLASCSHPFIVRLYKSFKDSTSIYMLMEFVQGGELLSLIYRTGKKMSDSEVSFYGASVLLALDYLHSKSIAYR